MIQRCCSICGTSLRGPKRHGFVINNGKALSCGNTKRHDRLKKGKNRSSWEEDFVKEVEEHYAEERERREKSKEAKRWRKVLTT
jgi:hypothetical protein